MGNCRLLSALCDDKSPVGVFLSMCMKVDRCAVLGRIVSIKNVSKMGSPFLST